MRWQSQRDILSHEDERVQAMIIMKQFVWHCWVCAVNFGDVLVLEVSGSYFRPMFKLTRNVFVEQHCANRLDGESIFQ